MEELLYNINTSLAELRVGEVCNGYSTRELDTLLRRGRCRSKFVVAKMYKTSVAEVDMMFTNVPRSEVALREDKIRTYAVLNGFIPYDNGNIAMKDLIGRIKSNEHKRSCKNCQSDCKFRQGTSIKTDMGWAGCIHYSGRGFIAEKTPFVLHKIYFHYLKRMSRIKDITYKEFLEQKLELEAKNNVQMMLEKLSPKEISDVSFLPFVYTELAWHFALLSIKCATDLRVEAMKKLSRDLKALYNEWTLNVIRHIKGGYHEKLVRTTKEYINSIGHDISILYFGVNQNLKDNNIKLKYEVQQTYAVMAMLMVDMLKAHKVNTYHLLKAKLGKADPVVLDDETIAMYKGMYAFAGLKTKFNYDDKNINIALAIVKKRVDNLLFTDKL